MIVEHINIFLTCSCLLLYIVAGGLFLYLNSKSFAEKQALKLLDCERYVRK